MTSPTVSECGFRIVSRRSGRSTSCQIRPLRPSLLDPRLQGDPWITLHADDQAGLYFNGCMFATCGALSVDVPGLNAQLQALRCRAPRRR
jgi:hypothetical protein